MSWEKVKIKEIWKGFYDGPHATPPVSDCGGIFLGISNITPNGHIDLSDIKYISEQDLPKWTKRVVPQGGDIVFSYEATLNLYAIIPENFYGCLGRRMALIRVDENKISNKFLYYYFFSDEWRATIAENTIVGATVDRIPIAKFPEFPISLPSLKEQKRIADILSAYDDLIENNQKQIKLLEEAAQRLYKQWFIDLRYPGHETTPIVDGLPKGWKKGIVGEIAEFKRGKVITKAQVAEGNIPVVAGGLEPAYYHNTANTTAPVITVSGSGANAGFAQLYNENVFASDCSFADINTTPYVYFVYCLLKDKKTELDSLQKGAAQPHVYAKDINALATLIPPEEMLKLYTKYASPYFEKVKALKEQIKNLTQSRDRLLPKLMNDEINI